MRKVSIASELLRELASSSVQHGIAPAAKPVPHDTPETVDAVQPKPFPINGGPKPQTGLD